ncbi:LOW QUALITY PROTEIN: ataxin-2 homolog [Rhopalosiphum maidis]|uniref:LOW QUALITY PROTEIN: ataxin-2 homolog n=1 Tax=Rhopalosiphum maidis TaxID=43146 RepID=UPI000EFF70A3|nr:LOW QUALITY PROTEIN: ataxin-2 homolog [Rhopalosiphum maidis]
MRRLKIIFICKLTICLLTWSIFVAELDALRGSAVVLQARAKADKKNSDPDEAIDVDENGEQVELNVTTTTKPTLTGIPQIDYVHDPNLPRELNGYNLTDYPFLNSVPEEIEFKCDGLHDGFYASIPHKCQLYHHCLFGTRFDFLCANYTAFDQKTFICHFVSQVDCPNSAKYFSRNDALYKAAETTTLPTTTTSTTAAPQQPQQQQQQQQQLQPQQQQQQQPFYPQYQQQQMPYEGRRAMPPGYAQGRKRRPTYRRRRPVYEYYYVDDYDDQQEYYDDSVEHMPVAKKPIRKHSRFNNYKQADLEADYQGSSLESDAPPSGNFKQHRGQQHAPQQQQQQQQQQQPRQQQQPSSATAVTKNVSNQISSVYDKPRAPPKIRRPVPINERDRYDYTSVSKSGLQPGPSAAAAPASTTTATSTTSTTTEAAPANPGSKAKEPPRPAATEDPVEYYDDDEEVVADDEYAAEPEVPAAVKSAVAATAAASKPDQAVKPAKAAAARTAAVHDVDYDADRGRRPSVATVRANKPSSRVSAPVAPPQPQQSAAPRKRPAADRAADDYEDELPAAATRQSISAATKQRASGPFLMRPSKPTKINRSQPADVDDEGADEPAEAVYQQARQPQRVSVRQVMAVSHNNRHRPQQQQQQVAATQYNSNKHAARATSAANRMRPMRPVYEYADEYYDE